MKTKAWIAENGDLVEKEKQLEIEHQKRELRDTIPITVRNAVQHSVQKEKVIMIGRVKKRSSPIFDTRKVNILLMIWSWRTLMNQAQEFQ